MHHLVLALVLFTAPAFLAGVTLAQSNAKAPTSSPHIAMEPDEIPPGFRPVKGAPDVAQIDPNPLVVGAYAAFFLGVFGYVVYLAWRQTEMAREMEDLAAQIQKVDRA